MKKILLLLIASFIPFLLSAQKVDISKDGTVKVDGKPSFKIEGKQGMVHTTFSVYNLDGDLLIGADAPGGAQNMVVTFTGSNASLDYPLTIGTKKVFAKELVRMHVIQDGQLNPEGMKRFVAKYNGRADQDLVLTDRNTQNTIQVNMQPRIVERNRSGSIFLRGNIISQGGQEIGRIENSKDNNYGKITQMFTITNIDGDVVATAEKAQNSTEIMVYPTVGDPFTMEARQSYENEISLNERIAKELIRRGKL